jgi:hypothetical protein
MEELLNSVDQNMFVQGLLLTRGVKTYGDIWEKCATCTDCLFAKQCQTLGAIMEAQGKNPTCGQIVDLLTGEIKPDDKSIPNI